VRGFVILTASVLLVIGIGVGTLAATTPKSPIIQCTSVLSCLEIKQAYGFDASVLIPTQRDLRFRVGWVYPNEATFSDRAGQEQWGMRLDFYDSHSKRRFEWVMDSWPVATIPLVATPNDALLLARGGLRVLYYGGIVHFWVNHIYYFADDVTTPLPPVYFGPSPYRTWLLHLVSERRWVDGT
jgi:hypothetical protein